MKLLITGATGFVGQHLVPELLRNGHEITVLSRSREKAQAMPWYDQVTFVPFDILDLTADPVRAAGVKDGIIHLAWPGLTDYDDLAHIIKSLPASFSFIRKMVLAGVRQVLVTGTCFEYGLQSGPLSEDLPALPVTSYGIGKNALRQFLQAFQKKENFVLQWVRLFYMYGPGQNPRSLFAQLDRAIDNKDEFFNMSSGEQLRDYLPVEDVARRLAAIASHTEFDGIINCCGGRPVSVRRLVEERIAAKNSGIKINPGYYPYTENASLAFWGDARRINALLEAS